MNSHSLAATWRERLKGALRFIAMLIGLTTMPLGVKTVYTGQGSILDLLNVWLLVGPLFALVGFLLPVGAGSFTPLPPRERCKVALVTTAVGVIGAVISELVIFSIPPEDRLGAAVTAALLVAVWMGPTTYVF